MSYKIYKLFIDADKHNTVFDGSHKQFIYPDKVMFRIISI